MDAKKEYIANMANQLVAKNSKITGEDLAIDLNSAGHKTYYNDTYAVGGRGVYTLVHATYDSLIKESRQPEANNVANAFIDANGKPAWDK
ncbi:hypothetical protein G6M26_23330 [Agrobacterium tumefaciens]|nr:hypothetical protein [Agrobacterium tumefaciens]NTE21476.1 hypothetical protein [Agrobacterium tumefaciens]